VLHCADVSYEEAGQESPLDMYQFPATAFDFKNLTVQCLIASDYTNPVDYTVETLVLYVQFDEMTAPDRSIETPLILGIVIRLAMRMGIHRSPKTNSGLTPFQDEMRRRLWGAILILDTLHSFQLSLPSTIGHVDRDCAMARNIHSHEFGPDSAELPRSRSLSEHTEATYVIIKTRLLLVLKDIIALTHEKEDLGAEQIKKLEQTLAGAYATIPLSIQETATQETFPVLGTLRGQAIAYDRVYQLCKCMLYRKFVRKASTDPSINRYRNSCLDAALRLLRHQTTLFLHLRPMFSPCASKRHKFTHPTLDFFVAGMIIAVDLYHTSEAVNCVLESSEQASLDSPRRVEMIRALGTSIEFWAHLKDFSVEAARAYSIFSFVLQKFKASQPVCGNDCDGTTTEHSNWPIASMEFSDETPTLLPEENGFDWVIKISDLICVRTAADR
jgi:hypothetical protein